MKYLVAGLGNPGDEYAQTRHNIGFDTLDALTGASNVIFDDARLAYRAEVKHKGRTLVLIKPTTFMNLSGKAVNYWLNQEKIPLQNLLIVTDDLALPLGVLRLKGQGSDGGHNGLKSINEILGTSNYARLRFGIGNDFPRGHQVDYVLSGWDENEKKQLEPRIAQAAEMIKGFATAGLQLTMTQFNNK